MAKRNLFSSQLTTVLTMIGVAVGLGNVWRFPYMMGQYGGSAFLFVYLLFTILFALPALMGEIGLGRATRKGILGAFSEALGNRWGKGIGYMLLGTILIASSYYVVVIANVIFTAYFSVATGFSETAMPEFERQLGNGYLQYGIVLATLLGSCYILHRGLRQGIEWVSKVFVPFFLIIILYLIINAFSLDGAKAHFAAFLRPDFSAMTAKDVFAALGQAFYSLSLGGTFMVMYGSYIKPEDRLPKLALWTGVGDVGAALLAGLFVVPTVLVFGLDMTAGPQLIFVTLPRLFIEMPGGAWIGFLFMLVLSMVAILSLIGALEAAVGAIADISWLKWSRTKTIVVVGLIEVVLAFPSAFDSNLIGTLDLIFGSGMQVLGSGLALIALSWGLGKTVALHEIFGESPSGKSGYFVWIKWVVPFVLLVVLIGYIYSSL